MDPPPATAGAWLILLAKLRSLAQVYTLGLMRSHDESATKKPLVWASAVPWELRVSSLGHDLV
jgi:hypothetical protein